jgi:hypothetical protein
LDPSEKPKKKPVNSPTVGAAKPVASRGSRSSFSFFSFLSSLIENQLH